ncbi:MAG: hypothetical protein KatS3mg105_4645 [Gemmatales bacterium]|nr:MAG: hypothetical protein KatS3mg105_4645 [Gemmatales bacterium]
MSTQSAFEKANAEGEATPPARPAAWEEIEPGRFQPRRIRGSHHGRALG